MIYHHAASNTDGYPIKFKVPMKVESTQPPLSTPSPGPGRVGSPAGAAFSTLLQNATSTTSTTSTTSQARLSTPRPGVATSQSLLTTSHQLNPMQSVNERALGLRAYRQELLASNIANADTPNYKAVDIDINDALRTGKTQADVQVQYRTPAQGSVDGNTVDMDVEQAQFAQNGVMYEYTVDRIKGFYKMMDDLLKNTPY